MRLITSSLERKFKKILPSFIKNFTILLLCNSFFGKLIKFFKIKTNLFGGFFDYSLVSDKDAARIFWGVWESAEIRFSKRFANSQTIIELGSSVGVTLGVLSKKRKNTKFICIEASKKNFENLKILKDQLSKENDYILINKALAYGVEEVSFFKLNTSTSHQIDFSKDTQKKKYNVPTDNVMAISLSKVIENYDVKGKYCLISDIEGADAAIFYNDIASLDNCERIIAELDDSPLGTIEDQIEKLKSIGFSVTERYGQVIVMSR